MEGEGLNKFTVNHMLALGRVVNELERICQTTGFGHIALDIKDSFVVKLETTVRDHLNTQEPHGQE